MNRFIQSVLICILVVLIGYWAISFIRPVSEAGFPTDTFRMLAKIIVWFVAILLGANHLFYK